MARIDDALAGETPLTRSIAMARSCGFGGTARVVQTSIHASGPYCSRYRAAATPLTAPPTGFCIATGAAFSMPAVDSLRRIDAIDVIGTSVYIRSSGFSTVT